VCKLRAADSGTCTAWHPCLHHRKWLSSFTGLRVVEGMYGQPTWKLAHRVHILQSKAHSKQSLRCEPVRLGAVFYVHANTDGSTENLVLILFTSEFRLMVLASILGLLASHVQFVLHEGKELVKCLSSAFCWQRSLRYLLRTCGYLSRAGCTPGF
jgi:hypothetical protein